MASLSRFSTRSNIVALRFAILAVQITSSPVMATDTGDDLTNNLFTDIAPLLSLFGERVAQQFLATSMGVVDNIIFAIAPLGIITAIVGAIRCSGTAGLKSLIGRSREGRGTVEVELLSSTSSDVAELWNGSGIVRVLGKANIMQVVYITPDGAAPKDAEPLDVQDSGTELNPLGVAEQEISIYDFNGAVTEGVLINRQREVAASKLTNWQREVAASKLTSLIRPFLNRLRLPTWEHRGSNNTTAVDDSVQDHSIPNISLNVSALRASSAESWAVAVIGALLQLAVIAFAGITVFFGNWKAHFQKGGKTAEPYAFWIFALGLVTLLLGIFLCARIIDKNTTEEEWNIKRLKGKDTGLAWLQKGGTVGDQLFDSYIIQPYGAKNTPRKKRWPILGEFYEAWSTRPMRAPVIVTSRRSNTAAKSQNLLTVFAAAISLIGYVLYFLGLRFLHFSVTLFQLALTFVMVLLRAWIRRNMVHEPEHQRVPENFELESAAKLICRCNLWNVVSRFSDDGSDKTKLHTASEVLQARQKLSEFSGWPGPCDDAAAEVTEALESAMNFVFSEPGFLLKDGWSSRTDFDWKLLVEVGFESGKGAARLEEITLKLSRRKLEGGNWSRWTVQTNIKSILGLWATTFYTPSGNVHELAKGYQTLRIYGHFRVATRFIFEKWVRRPQSAVKLLERDSVWERNPAQFTVGYPFTMAHGTENWVGVLSNATIHRACGQLIFSEFISALANDIIKTTQFGIQRGSDTNSPTPQLGDLIDRLTQTGLFNPEEAYLSIVDTLAGAQKLAIIDPSCIEGDTSAIYDGAKVPAAPLWLSYLAETVCSFYKLSENWDEATNTYLTLLDHFSNEPALVGPLRDRLDLFMERASLPSSKLQNSIININLPDRMGRKTFSEMSRGWEDELRNWKRETPEENRQGVKARSQELLKAADAGRLSIVGELVSDLDSIDIDASDDLGCTALILASRSGHAAIVGMLLGVGANVNYQDIDYRTALHYAAERNHASVAMTLLLRGETRHRLPDKDGCTPWDLATSRKHTELLSVLRFYCSRNDDVSWKTWSQLHWCTWMGWCSVEPLSLTNLGEVENTTMREVIDIAALNGGYDTFRRLLDTLKGSDTDQLPFLESAWDEVAIEDVALAAKLLDRGADVLARDSYGVTPLHRAAEGGYTATTALLLDRGADVLARTSGGWTPLHAAVEGGHTATTALLLDRGADVLARTSGGRTPLHVAAEGGHTATAALLLDRGADVLARTSGGRTPLYAAAEGGHTATAALLLDRGADVLARGLSGGTLLHAAAEGGHTATAALLLDRGADVLARDLDGWTPLHAAARGGHTATATLLLDRGADVQAQNSRDETPLDMAVRWGKTEVAALLRGRGASP